MQSNLPVVVAESFEVACHVLVASGTRSRLFKIPFLLGAFKWMLRCWLVRAAGMMADV